MNSEFPIVILVIAIVSSSFWIGQSIRVSADAIVSEIAKQTKAQFELTESLAVLSRIIHDMEGLKRLLYKQVNGRSLADDE